MIGARQWQIAGEIRNTVLKEARQHGARAWRDDSAKLSSGSRYLTW